MFRNSWLIPLALGAALAVPPALTALAAEKTLSYTFEEDQAGAPPGGFTFGRTGFGRDGRWVVQEVTGAPSGKHVLAQVDADRTDYRFPVAIADSPSATNVKATVRFRAISGQGDQGAGLIFRYRDAKNYYVARANALEDNVNLYRVKWGIRTQVKGWNGRVTSGAWHSLSIQAEGDHLQVGFDGKEVVNTHDGTFKGAGKVGLWTKADSVIWFDDLTIEPLAG